MKTPPLLLLAGLTFWGWQTGFLWVGVLLGIALELPAWIKVRWEFSDIDYTRIWTLCSVLLLVAAIYTFTANEAPSELLGFLQNPNLQSQRNAGNSSARAVAELIRWQPMIFFPFVVAATCSVRGGVPLHTISLILQRRWRKAQRNQKNPAESDTVNVSYPYFALALFSASIQSTEDSWFYYGLCFLLAWALFPLRSRRFSVASWAVVLLVASSLGYIGQVGVNELQHFIIGINAQLLSKYGRYRFDPLYSRTMIGQIGRLKQSGSILVRLACKDGSKVPPLLREASYRDYKGQVWFAGATRDDFERVTAETNSTSWLLMPDKPVMSSVNVACYLPGGTALLPLPRGSARLDNLHAYLVHKNPLGAVQAEGPGLVVFDALYGAGATMDSVPDQRADTSNIPPSERTALRSVLDELHLEGRSLHETLQALQTFFNTKFTYSTWQEPQRPFRSNETPLSRFLLQTRTGHCEYFATATVLLLRQLGFPARYAVGYAVHESSGKDKFVVRQRDAHAWCMVWNNGTWHDFDTTPGTWVGIEGERASALQSFSDFWSRVSFEIAKIRWGESHLRAYLLGTSVPLLAVLLVQIFRTRRKRHRAGAGKPIVAHSWPGTDSEWYTLAARLATQGFERRRSEPLADWLERLSGAPQLSAIREPLRDLLSLHYRYRFDPAGLPASERELLRMHATRCLARLQEVHSDSR